MVNHYRIFIDNKEIYLVCKNWEKNPYNISCNLCPDSSLGRLEIVISHYISTHYGSNFDVPIHQKEIRIESYNGSIQPLMAINRRIHKNTYKSMVCYYCRSPFEVHQTIILNEKKLTPICQGNKLPMIAFCTEDFMTMTLDKCQEHLRLHHKDKDIFANDFI